MDTMQIIEVSDRIYREASRAQVQELRGLFDDAKATLLAALQIAQEHKIPFDEVGLHGQLRDLALKQGDLASYVEHNNAYQRINEEINGKETTTRLAIQEAERRIALERLEHQKHLAILHSTLPQHIADRVARGEVVNDHHDNAAVIFLDIAGFTSISDQLTSTEVVQLLDTVFTALDSVCKKHDVVKIKTIGDSYMAVAFPQESSSSEQRVASIEVRAANAALDMLTSIAYLPESLPESLRETIRETLPSGLQVRIGLHCGPVTAGVIGKQRMQYDVWGDTVNVASRMESTGEPGRIHVSSSFALALNGEKAKERKGETDVIPSDSEERGTSSQIPVTSSLIPRGEMDIKGKGSMKTYWLESASA
jgi:class 3 adenylate cyclase